MISPLSVFQYVSMSVGKRVFFKMRFLLKLLMKLGALRVKTDIVGFFGQNLVLGIRPKNTPKIGFFGFRKKNSLFMCKIFGSKPCIIMTFMILLKSHVWKKSGSRVKCKNALGLSDCRIFKL